MMTEWKGKRKEKKKKYKKKYIDNVGKRDKLKNYQLKLARFGTKPFSKIHEDN